jgi:NitT/TauT family transport system ATP-binding protein
MDEPFGALDALTREQLQRDLERMWLAQKPTVLFVTHDVGEAVCLADRVVVLAGKPGTVVANIRIGVGRARGADLLNNPQLQAYAKEVRSVLLPQEAKAGAVLTMTAS